MTFLLLRVSGVALLERSLVRTRADYRDYIERTSAFFPRPPRERMPMNPEITFLHDGDCPLCAREVAMLRAPRSRPRAARLRRHRRARLRRVPLRPHARPS